MRTQIDDLKWWGPVHALFLTITTSLPEKQQHQILRKMRGLARLREESGDVVTANFLRDLAGEDFVEPQPKRSGTHLRLVQ